MGGHGKPEQEAWPGLPANVLSIQCPAGTLPEPYVVMILHSIELWIGTFTILSFSHKHYFEAQHLTQGCVILQPGTDFLRISVLHEIIPDKLVKPIQNLSLLEYTPLSMIAEIGGFVGLFLGLSVVDVRLLIGRWRMDFQTLGNTNRLPSALFIRTVLIHLIE